MRRRWILLGVALAVAPAAAGAQSVAWQRYVTPGQGASVEMPVSIFSEDAGPAKDGAGRRFLRSDHRADLTVTSITNRGGDTPASFLAKLHPPAGIVYRKVTPNFFVVSSFRKDKIWYTRCNRSRDNMNCVLINYPAAEKRSWDSVVTRISQSLSH